MLEQELLFWADMSVWTQFRSLNGMFFAGMIALICNNAESQNLFVADNTNIYEFTPDGVQSTFASGSAPFSGLAIDSAGNLFASQAAISNGVITGINIIKIKPDGTQTIFSPFTNSATAMAFNGTGDLFVSSSATTSDIYEFTTNGIESTFATGVDQFIEGLAFNGAGDLFVSCQGNPSIIEISPSGVISTFATNVVEPFQLAFNSKGNLFVADCWPPGYVYEYTPDGVQSTVGSGLSFPRALAIDSADNLFASDLVSNLTGADIIKIEPDGTQSIFASGLSFPLAFAFQPIPQLQAVANGGTVEIMVSMPFPYYSTIIQGSTDLINWVNIYTNTPPFTFTNSIATASPCCFYRAVLSP